MSITTAAWFLNAVNVLQEGAVGDGVTDDTVKLQAAIDSATASGKSVYFPAKTYLVSPKQARNPASKDWWCLWVPSNAKLIFQPGAVLRLMDNAPSWTRVLVMNQVSNVQIEGHVEIDGRCTTVKAGNEHMAGIFIFSSKDISLRSAYSHDTYGDNIFVGGSESAPSVNIELGYFKGTTAGRKNFVVHYVDKMHVQTAILDNSRGGAPAFQGSNSLDLEPDDFQGSRLFAQRFDYLSTYGTGNDFSVGITEKQTDNWIFDVGTFDIRTVGTVTASAREDLPSILMYALTMRIGMLTVLSTDDRATSGVQMAYGGKLYIGSARLTGGRGMAFDLRASNGSKPKVSIGSVSVNRPLGGGILNWGADLHVGLYEADNIGGRVLDVYSTAQHTIKIDELRSNNSGLEQLVYLSTYDVNKLILDIDTLSVFDSRSAKPKRIVEFATGNAMDGTTIGSLNNPQKLTEWATSYNTLKPFYKLTGGDTLAGVFLTKDTPDGNVTAPVGSLALRTDGASGVLYLKESGTDKKGWSAVASAKSLTSFYLDDVPKSAALKLVMKRNAGTVSEYVMPSSGLLSGYGSYSTSPSAGGAFKFKIFINGIDRGTYAGGDDTSKSFDLPAPITFNAGDRLSLQVVSSVTKQSVSLDMMTEFN